MPHAERGGLHFQAASADPAPPPETPDQPPADAPPPPPPQPKASGRLFFLLPNYLTVQGQDNAPPLTAGQKYSVVARSSFDYVQYPWYAFLAGISQADNSEPTYGRGLGGYGRRYATSFADGTIENFGVGAFLPTIFREDPRDFQMGSGGFGHRTAYAVTRNVVTRTDAGHREMNLSELLGSALAATASNAYHPRAERTVANTLTVWRTLMTYDTLTNLMKEFWPDLRRVL